MRTEVEKLSELVVACADLWVKAREGPYGEGNPYGTLSDACDRLTDAVKLWRAEIARQDVKAKTVFLRTDASPEERLAAQRAMISRPGWRQCIYDLLRISPRSDRGLELICLGFRGRRFDVRNPGSNVVSHVDIPDRQASHQTISSARNSLCRAGLVYSAGAEKIHNQTHTLWRAREIG